MHGVVYYINAHAQFLKVIITPNTLISKLNSYTEKCNSHTEKCNSHMEFKSTSPQPYIIILLVVRPHALLGVHIRSIISMHMPNFYKGNHYTGTQVQYAALISKLNSYVGKINIPTWSLKSTSHIVVLRPHAWSSILIMVECTCPWPIFEGNHYTRFILILHAHASGNTYLAIDTVCIDKEIENLKTINEMYIEQRYRDTTKDVKIIIMW